MCLEYKSKLRIRSCASQKKEKKFEIIHTQQRRKYCSKQLNVNDNNDLNVVSPLFFSSTSNSNESNDYFVSTTRSFYAIKCVELFANCDNIYTIRMLLFRFRLRENFRIKTMTQNQNKLIRLQWTRIVLNSSFFNDDFLLFLMMDIQIRSVSVRFNYTPLPYAFMADMLTLVS